MSSHDTLVADASFLIVFSKCKAFENLEEFLDKRDLHLTTSERVKDEVGNLREDQKSIITFRKVDLRGYKRPKSLSKADATVLKLASNNKNIIAVDEKALRNEAKLREVKWTGSVSILMQLYDDGIIKAKRYNELAECFIKDLHLNSEIIENMRDYAN